jgi:hypothetical protein
MSSPSFELAVLTAPSTGSRQSAGDGAERDRLIRRAKALSWLSLAYMTAEGAIAITAAILASSVALLGFGLDSVIEGLASVIVIWRFTGTRRLAARAEQRAQRLVAITFFLLAPYIAQDAIRTLVAGEHPATSWLGIGLAISSIIVMPLLGKTKHRIGQRLGSAATAGEGTQNMLCAYLAAGVLTSLMLNAALGLWWADPVVALAIAALALHEGRATWQGEGCCSTATIDAGSACMNDCCDAGAALSADASSRLPAAEPPMVLAGCGLSAEELCTQSDRYRRLGATAAAITLREYRLSVTFGTTLDRKLLDETISVERGCCTFFTIDYDESCRTLSIAVDDPSRLDQLTAVDSALRGAVPVASAR